MLLLDTSGLLCYVHKSEPQHQQAVQFLDASNKNLTHSYVLAEFVALALVRRFSRLATLAFISDLLVNPDIEVVWVDEALHCEAVRLLMERPDKNYSLCDAVSFVLMRQRGLNEALTTDRHFEQRAFSAYCHLKLSSPTKVCKGTEVRTLNVLQNASPSTET